MLAGGYLTNTELNQTNPTHSGQLIPTTTDIPFSPSDVSAPTGVNVLTSDASTPPTAAAKGGSAADNEQKDPKHQELSSVKKIMLLKFGEKKN